MRTVILCALAASATTFSGFADCRVAATAITIRELPRGSYAAARSVAWRDDNRLLIGTRGNGIVEYDLRDNTSRRIIEGSDIPYGIPDVENLDTDGKTLVAFNREHTDIAVNLETSKITHTRRAVPMRVRDMAVRGDDVVVLGYSFAEPRKGGPLWTGKTGAPWSTYKLLHDHSKKHEQRHQLTIAPHAGAVAFAGPGVVALITPAEPGVLRFRLDGTALKPLGTDMTALTVDLSAAIVSHSQDVERRYAELNQHPLVDDLVVLPSGPAVIVREWSAGKVRWALWLPSETSPTRKLRLGLEDARASGGHLRCSARGWTLGCVFGKTQAGSSDAPRLALIDVRKGVERCK